MDDLRGRLTISDATVADSGEYVCTASGASDAPVATVRLDVEICESHSLTLAFYEPK